MIQNVIELRYRRVFLISRSMDNLLLNRVNSWQGLIKKEQEPIYEKLIGLPHNLKIYFIDEMWVCACSF